MILSLPVNSGYGTALQTGYKYAVRNGYTIVGQIDADGQHRAEYLPEMLTALNDGDADVVIGSRFLHPEGYEQSAARKVGISFFARIATRLTRQHVTDPTSGFQVMRLRVAEFLLAPASAIAHIPAIVATRVETDRTVPLRRACGRYVDWYQADR
jgi:glycosyltransferase involved in cell wall biosynthesis